MAELGERVKQIKAKDLRTPDTVPDPADPFRQVRVEHIYSHGFPLATPETQAEATTRAAILRELRGGRIVHLERVDTPEHTAAGEYLMTAWVTELPRPSSPGGQP